MRPGRTFRGPVFAALALSAMGCGSAELIGRDGGAGNADAAAGAAGARGAGGAAGAGGLGGAVDDGARDGSSDPCVANGTGAIGVLGCACSSLGKLACNGNAQAVTLICSQGICILKKSCGGSTLCDSRVSTCQPIDSLCEDVSSGGQNVCSSSTTVARAARTASRTSTGEDLHRYRSLCSGGNCVCGGTVCPKGLIGSWLARMGV